MAFGGRQRGMTVIAVTSLAHSQAQAPRHVAGRLFENADIVIDTGAPEGDALVEIPGLAYKVASASTIAACIIVDALVAETARRLVERGVEPLVYPSHNIGADQQTEARTIEQEMRVLNAYRELQRRV
jgi:uncharacterized phosphosugar-binding protein